MSWTEKSGLLFIVVSVGARPLGLVPLSDRRTTSLLTDSDFWLTGVTQIFCVIPSRVSERKHAAVKTKVGGFVSVLFFKKLFSVLKVFSSSYRTVVFKFLLILQELIFGKERNNRP